MKFQEYFPILVLFAVLFVLSYPDSNTLNVKIQKISQNFTRFVKKNVNVLVNGDFSWKLSSDNICSKGPFPFSTKHLLSELDKFVEVFKSRPQRDNGGGTQLNHQFALWTLIRHLKPDHIIESGVNTGLGTWMMRQAAPTARLTLIDPTSSNLVYKDNHTDTIYYMDDDFEDFGDMLWNDTDPNKTLVFFDDHQNAVKRVHQAAQRGLKHLIFDDNWYLAGKGDCFTFKEACMVYHDKLPADYIVYDNFRKESEKLSENHMDLLIKSLLENVQKTFEFPPIWKMKKPHISNNYYILDMDEKQFNEVYGLNRTNSQAVYANIAYVLLKSYRD